MKQGWEKVKIDTICQKIFSGGTPSRKVNEYYEGGTVPWLTTKLVNFERVYATEQHVTELGLQKSSAKMIPENSVIIAMYGDGKTAGKCAINKIPLATNQACCNLIINHDIADYEFVFYSIRSRYRELVSLKQGGAQQNLNAKTLKNFEIKMPPLPMQKKIAGILSGYDELIENNQRRIQILEEMAQTIYREWFVNFKFPGHEKVKITDGIPEGWEIKKLGDVAESMRRNVPKGELDDPQPYVGLEHIPRRSLALDAWETVTDLGSNKLAFKEGEVLFGKIRPYFHKVCVAPFDGLCSADTIVIRARRSELYALVTMCVSSDDFVAHATATSNGSKMPRANWRVLEDYPITIPAGHVAEKFSTLVADIFAQQKSLVFKIQNLRATRDLLLPKLISGEIEV